MASVVAVAAAGVPRLLETDVRGTKNLVLGLAFRLGLLDGRNDPCFDASIIVQENGPKRAAKQPLYGRPRANVAGGPRCPFASIPIVSFIDHWGL